MPIQIEMALEKFGGAGWGILLLPMNQIYYYQLVCSNLVAGKGKSYLAVVAPSK